MKWLFTVGTIFLCMGSNLSSESERLSEQVYLHTELTDQHTFSWQCPLGHPSPDGSGMCNKSGCRFQKK